MSFRFELRHAVRALVRNRTITLSAAGALALGVSATTTLFGIVHGATQGLPFAQAKELVALTQRNSRQGDANLGAWAFDYRAWSQARSFDGLAAFTTTSINLGGSDAAPDRRAPERRSGALIEPQTFALLGVTPLRGRVFTASEASTGSKVAIISYDLWQSRFASVDLLGQNIRINGESHTVIGIMPSGFGFPINEDVWLPFSTSATTGPQEGDNFTVFGRLRDGVNMESAQAELQVIGAQLARAQPATHGTRNVRVMPYENIEMEPSAVPVLYIMLLAVSFVLLIACANVANLLIARAAQRSREYAVRVALGAGRRRIAFQQLLESLLVAMIGGAGGLLLAWLGVSYFDRSTAHILEAFWIDFRIDRTVLLVTMLSITGAGLLAGLAPALRVSATPAATVLKESASSGLRMGRLSRALVVAELALACGLLVVSGILVKAAVGLRATKLPFDAEQIYVAQIGVRDELPGQRLRELTESIQQIAGVKAAALTSVLPGRGTGLRAFTLDGAAAQRAEDVKASGSVLITPGFLETLGGHVLRGRDLSWRDDAVAARVALVNDSWVERFSAERDPIGRIIKLAGLEPVTIVGVIPDLQMQDPGDVRGDGIYLPMAQNQPFAVRLMASTDGDVPSLTPQVRARLAEFDADLPLFEIATLRQAIFADKAVLDTMGRLFALFGASALFLTIIGLYGVVSFGVTQRTRELGIRMSLGAQRSDILRLVLRQGARSIAIGAGTGLLIGVALSTALNSAFEWMPRADPTILGGVLGALVVTAFCALAWPARRAARLSPQHALRSE